MVISSRHTLQSLNDYTMNIHIDGVPINRSNQSKSLGITIDENLSWKAHIHEISKQVSSGIGALKWVRQFVSIHTAIKIYNGLIEPHVDYCSAVWDGLTQQLGEKLQKTSKSCHQSYNFQAMIRVLDIFLTRLVGTIYRLGGLNKRLV